VVRPCDADDEDACVAVHRASLGFALSAAVCRQKDCSLLSCHHNPLKVGVVDPVARMNVAFTIDLING